MSTAKSSNSIGTLTEKSLHASLKEHYAQRGDEIETELEGYLIDIKHGPLLIEIQTRNFGAIKRKLQSLLPRHPILLIHPIAQNKWITRINTLGRKVARRKSPKLGRAEDLFAELLRIPHLVSSPNLSIEIALIDVEEFWVDDGQGSWRRGKWSIQDRKMLRFNQGLRFEQPLDYLNLIPSNLPTPFTVKQLAQASRITSRQSGKMAYSLRKMGLLEVVYKQGNAHVLDLVPRLS